MFITKDKFANARLGCKPADCQMLALAQTVMSLVLYIAMAIVPLSSLHLLQHYLFVLTLFKHY